MWCLQLCSANSSLLWLLKVKVKSLSRVQLCDPMDYRVHGILQARTLEWVAFPFSRGSSQPRDQTQVSSIAGGFFTSWATKKAQSQRKAMPKNIQTTTQLNLFPMLARWRSKSSKLGFNSKWTKNVQMYQLDLEKSGNQRSNCQHPLGHGKSKRIPEKHLLLLHWLC